MAKNWQFPGDGPRDGGGGEPPDWSGSGTVVLEAQNVDHIDVPDGGWILQAKFVRQGGDLLLVGQDGSQVLLKGYFAQAQLPDLITPAGAMIKGSLAAKLAGPMAPGELAQAGPAGATDHPEPIGKVVNASGRVEATHADGTKVTLHVGDPVYQGDVIETGPLGAVGLEFADESTFSLADKGRMVLDEMVYDPGAANGRFGASIVQGAFSFISGQIAKTGPDNMLITTPTATIGIRGTALAGKAAPEGEQSNFTILPEGQFVGEVVISNNAGTVVLNQVGATVSLTSINFAPPPPIVITQAQIQQQYATVLQALPVPPSSNGNDLVPGQQGTDVPQPEHDALEQIAQKLAQLDHAITQGLVQQQVFEARLEQIQNLINIGLLPPPVARLPEQVLHDLIQQAGLNFNSTDFTSINQALTLLVNASVTAANAETAASTAVASLSGSISVLAPNVGFSSTDTDSIISVVTAPLEALNAARALSEALVTMIQAAQTALAIAGSGGTVDAATIAAIRAAVGLDGATGDNLFTAATEISKVVTATISAAEAAKTAALNMAGSGVTAAMNAAAQYYNANISTHLAAAGASITDINQLETKITFVQTQVTAIRDIAAANANLPAEFKAVLDLAVNAATSAVASAVAAKNTLNTDTPADILMARDTAASAAADVQGFKNQAITAYDAFKVAHPVNAAVAGEFQNAAQNATSANTAATQAASAITGASSARVAAQAFKDGTAQADVTTKHNATVTAEATATTEKAQAVTAADAVQAARADLLLKLIDEAKARATADTFEDAAKSAEAIQKGASDGDKGDVVVGSDGHLTYVADASNASLSGLAVGASTTDSFKVATVNASGGYDLKIVTVTITNNGGTLTVSDQVTITSGSGDSATTTTGLLSGQTVDAARQELAAAQAALDTATTAYDAAVAAGDSTPALAADLALATQNYKNAQDARDFQLTVFNLFLEADQNAQARARGAGDGQKGEVTFDSNGNVVYTPDADAFTDLQDGHSTTDTFKISALNDAGGYDLSTVEVTITRSGSDLVVSTSVTVTAPDGTTTASVNLDALDEVTAGNVGYIHGAEQVAEAFEASAGAARTDVDALVVTANTELNQSLAAIDALAAAQAAEATATGYLAVAQAAAQAQAQAAFDIAIGDVSTLSTQIAALAATVNADADNAQSHAILGSANKVLANAAAHDALEVLYNFALAHTTFNAATFFSNAANNQSGRASILDFPVIDVDNLPADISDADFNAILAARQHVLEDEAALRDALVTAVKSYAAGLLEAIVGDGDPSNNSDPNAQLGAAELTYASQSADAVAARAAAVAAAEKQADAINELLDLVKAKSLVASAAADYADFINPSDHGSTNALASFVAAQSAEDLQIILEQGLVSAAAGSTPGTIVVTGNVPGLTLTFDVQAQNGGAIANNTNVISSTTAATTAAGQVTTISIGGTPEAGDVYQVSVSATLGSTTYAGSATITVTAGQDTLAAIRNALTQAINFDDILGGAQGATEQAAAAAAAAAAAKAAADVAAYNSALAFANAATADAATAAEQAAVVTQQKALAVQAAAQAAAAEASNNATAAKAASDIATAASNLAAIAQAAASAAAASAQQNATLAIAAASGAGAVIVNGTSATASVQADRASQAAAAAAAAAGVALRDNDSTAAAAADALASYKLQEAEDSAAQQAKTAAEEALNAATQAAADAQASADQAAADRLAERALAAEQAAAKAAEAETYASDNDPTTLDAAQAAATASALATSNVPGAAALAADAAEAARNAATLAQAAADAAQAIALGKGSAAQAQADRAQAAATAAAVSAGEAEAAATVASNADAAVSAWTTGEASTDRADAAITARDAASAAAKAAAASEAAQTTYDQAVTNAVAPNVALAAANAVVTSRENSLAQVVAQREAADDGDDSVDTAIEQVWDKAVTQAQQALSDAQDAQTQAQAAADAANNAVTLALGNATSAATAASQAAAQAAQAASDASFATAFEINAQGAAQTRVDNFLDDLAAAVGAALTTAKAQATEASHDATLATAAAADEANLDPDAAQDAADAASAAAQAALNALIQAASTLNLAISAETAAAVITAINAAADAAAALDDLSSDIATTDTLRAAQNAADTTQLAAVASIKAAAASALQAVNAANAALQVAQSQAAVATAGTAEREAAKVQAAEAALGQAQADAQAAADQADADAKEAASAQAAAQARVTDIQAAVSAAATARTAANTAAQAAADALTSLTQAQTARATAAAQATAATTAYNNSLAAKDIDPAAYQAVKQAYDQAVAALATADKAVAAAMSAHMSAADAATTADTAADKAEAAVATVNLTNAQSVLAAATSAATAAQTAANTAAAEAADAAARTSPGTTSAEIQAVADLATADATAAATAAGTAATQADIATAALADIPRASGIRTTAQAAADAAEAAAATAEGVAQTDTVTLGGTIEGGDTYSVTIDGHTVTLAVTSQTTLQGVRDALITAINSDATVKDLVTATAGNGNGLITLTAGMPGIGFTASAAAANHGAVDDQSASSATTIGNLGGATQVAQLDTVTLAGTVQTNDVYSVTVNGTTISVTVSTQTTLDQVRDAMVTAINNSAVASAVTAAAGDTANALTITSDVAGVGFTATATATDGGGNADNAAQSVTTTANLRGADDLAAQAATDAQAAAQAATTAAGTATTSAQTAAASIAANTAYNNAVSAASTAAAQQTIASQQSAAAALAARTAKVVGDAVSTALSHTDGSGDPDPDIIGAIRAQLETTQVTRVTLAGTVENGDVYRISVNGHDVTFTVNGQTTLDQVRQAFIDQINADATVNGTVHAELSTTADSIRLTALTPGVAFNTTATAVNGGATNDQAARVLRLVSADQATQADTVSVQGTAGAGDSYTVTINGHDVTVSVGSGLNVGDGPAAIAAALIQAINNDGAVNGAVTASAGSGTGAITITADAAGASGAFETAVSVVNGDGAGNNALVLSVLNITTVADHQAALAATADATAQGALAAATTAHDAAASALAAAQAAVALPGAGSVAQTLLTQTQTYVTNTNTSYDSVVRDAGAADQSAASAQAQADLAGADVGAVAAALAAANALAVTTADGDAEAAAQAAEAAFSQAEASASTALHQAQSAIGNGTEMLQLATSFDQVTLTGTIEDGDVFTLIIDPTPANGASGDETTVSVTVGADTPTVGTGATLADVRDALVNAVNTAAGTSSNALYGKIEATSAAGDGSLIVAAKTSGASIGVTADVTDAGGNGGIGAETGSSLIRAALTAAEAAKTTIDALFTGTLPNDAGAQTATALNAVVTALQAAYDATRQTISVTVGGNLEQGDTLSVTVDGTQVSITVGANQTLAQIRDALVTAINANGTIAGKVTAAGAFQSGELILLSNDPASTFCNPTLRMG